MNNGYKAKVVFADELKYIKSQKIKDYVVACFHKLTPEYFWDAPASSSGKYHPAVSNKKHGLVNHTKLCVWWGRKLAQTYNCEKNIDEIVASLLLHDLQKFGKEMSLYDGKPTLAEYTTTHGPMLAIQLEKILRDMYDVDEMEDEERQSLFAISSSVCLHMGRWTNEDLSKAWEVTGWKNNTVVDVVHMADYCASRQADSKMEELDNYEFPYFEENKNGMD